MFYTWFFKDHVVIIIIDSLYQSPQFSRDNILLLVYFSSILTLINENIEYRQARL